MNKANVFSAIVLVVAAGGIGYWLGSNDSQNESATVTQEKLPLYWVAPMDPDYKRDKPGKSPMGMDLIPVYEKGSSGPDAGPGAIRISPEVVNNLGVRTAVVERKALRSEIKTVGYVGYDEDQLVHIHPRVEGWIEKLYVKASGNPVKKGQALYDIYSPQLVNAQEELVLALNRNNQRLIKAAQDRLKALQLPQGAINKLMQSKQVQQRITFYSPQSGVVDNLKIREGFFVKPGTTLMSIGTLEQMWVEAEVFERQASLVAKGQPVTMTLDYLPGQEWQGKVNYVYPSLDSKTRTVKVRLRFDNKNHELKPNMFAQVAIHANNSKPGLLVPQEAVIRTGRVNRVVLALGDGRFKSIEVKVGRFADNYVEILAGLEEGESVVTSAQFLLDSESSKTSDFKRMHHDMADKDLPSSVWVEATLNSLMAGHSMVNVTHKAISEWDWPEMTMDFGVTDAVDFSKLEQGMTLHIEIQRVADDQYQVSAIHIPSDKVSDQRMDHEGMSHSEGMSMDHEGMSHSEGMSMDHEGMKQSQDMSMDHENMNHSNHSE